MTDDDHYVIGTINLRQHKTSKPIKIEVRDEIDDMDFSEHVNVGIGINEIENITNRWVILHYLLIPHLINNFEVY